MSESKGLVLVVDDEASILLVATEILRHLGYEVHACSSGPDALNSLREGLKPDLVLLDIIMPGMDGVQTFRKIREIAPTLPILISSGYADRASLKSLIEEGVSGFVNKPYRIETLAQRLEEVIR